MKPRRAMLVTLGLAAALLAGCLSLAPTPEHRLRNALDTYVTTMEALTAARRAGRISEAEYRRIEEARAVAWAALEDWRRTLELGLPAATAVERFNAAILRLIEAQIEAEGKRDGVDDL